MMRTTTGRRPAGFTLIELLVVISIIATLMGLLLSGVMKVRSAAVRTENNWRMQQITIAAKEFTTAHQVNYFPAASSAAPFRLRKQYATTDPELAYLKQVWPRMPYLVGPVSQSDDRYNPQGTGLPDVDLMDSNQVVMFFTTGGAVTNYEGFSGNSQQPFAQKVSPDEQRKGPYLKGLKPNMVTTANGPPQFVDTYGTPYAIFVPQKKSYDTTPAQAFGGMSPFYRGGSPKKFENPTDIQIISAGENKTLGAGGDWSAGVNAAGRDDTSNFSTSILGAGPP